MEPRKKPQGDTLNENLQNETPQDAMSEDTIREQVWWDSLCYPDAHESER